MFSPDRQWVAYVSNEGGELNVFVQPFLRPGGKYQISKDGGSQPVWRADGRELFYLTPDGTLMVVAIDATRQFAAGSPKPLFPTGVFLTGLSALTRGRVYAVTKDGKRFLFNSRLPCGAPITVVTGWTAETR